MSKINEQLVKVDQLRCAEIVGQYISWDGFYEFNAEQDEFQWYFYHFFKVVFENWGTCMSVIYFSTNLALNKLQQLWHLRDLQFFFKRGFYLTWREINIYYAALAA